MPEEKKDTSKSKSYWEEVILLILGIIALIFVFIPKIIPQNTNTDINTNQNQVKSVNIIESYNNIFKEEDKIVKDVNGQTIKIKKPSLFNESKSRLSDFLQSVSMFIFIILIFLIILFYIIINYNNFRKDLVISAYKKKFAKEDENLDIKNEKILEKSEPDNNGIINERWQLVGKYYNSANPSDWKLAIIESDIMLYEILDKSGFGGNSIGEMLKNTDKSKLKNLDAAWSAHKVRNEIAHSGLEYILTRQAVEKAIADYEKVFDELNFI